MNVTRPNNANYCCYAFVRSGIIAFGIGFTTNNSVWIGHPNTSRVLREKFMDISASQVRISGNFVAAGEVTAYSTSDIRLKKNITDITTEEATNILSKIRPVTYEWNDKAFELNSHQRYRGRETGLIAQELHPILPCAIKTVFEEYLSIDYTRLIPPIIAVVNEHEQEIRRLRREVEELKSKLRVLN